MTRLELIRSAGWEVSDYVIAVAREMGCTCERVILGHHVTGVPAFHHKRSCPAAGHDPGDDRNASPIDPHAVDRVEARLERRR